MTGWAWGIVAACDTHFHSLPLDPKADDRSRTGDLELGKLALYQLSYVRIAGLMIPKAILGDRRQDR